MLKANDPLENLPIQDKVERVLSWIDSRQRLALKGLIAEQAGRSVTLSDNQRQYVLETVVRGMLEHPVVGGGIDSLATYDWNQITNFIRNKIEKYTSKELRSISEQYNAQQNVVNAP